MSAISVRWLPFSANAWTSYICAITAARCSHRILDRRDRASNVLEAKSKFYHFFGRNFTTFSTENKIFPAKLQKSSIIGLTVHVMQTFLCKVELASYCALSFS